MVGKAVDRKDLNRYGELFESRFLVEAAVEIFMTGF